jgi:hypothetical protein
VAFGHAANKVRLYRACWLATNCVAVQTQCSPPGNDLGRFIGGDKIPEFWGKPSAYTEGTSFLGTPADHLEVRLMIMQRQCIMVSLSEWGWALRYTQDSYSVPTCAAEPEEAAAVARCD